MTLENEIKEGLEKGNEEKIRPVFFPDLFKSPCQIKEEAEHNNSSGQAEEHYGKRTVCLIGNLEPYIRESKECH